MAEQEKAQVNESSNGGVQSDEARQQGTAQAREISETYERAKQEMNEALARLRTEIDRINVAQTREQAEDWVKGNPTLATFLALGGGILVGRLLSAAFTPAPPPPLPVRVRNRAYGYASDARDYLDEASEAFLKGAAVAGGLLAAQAGRIGHDVADRTGEYADRLSRRTAELSDEFTTRTSDFSDEVSTRANKAAKNLESSAHDLSKSLRKQQKRARKKANKGMDAAESAVNAARTVVAAVLIKKVNDWIKRVT